MAKLAKTKQPIAVGKVKYAVEVVHDPEGGHCFYDLKTKEWHSVVGVLPDQYSVGTRLEVEVITKYTKLP